MRWRYQIACGIVLTLGVSLRADEFTTAAGYYSTGQWHEAISAFDRMIRQAPEHPQRADAEFFRAEALVQIHEYERAADRFGEFLSEHPRHALSSRALFRRGECFYLGRQPTEAIASLRQFSRDNPDDTLNRYALPYLAFLQFETDGASNDSRGALELALKAYPRGPLAETVCYRLVELDWRQKDAQAVWQRLADLKRDYPPTVNEPEWHLWNGALHQMSGNAARAIAEFEQVTHSEADPRIKARALFQASQVNTDRGNSIAALANLETLSSLVDGGPLVQRSYLPRIRLLGKGDRWSEARSVMDEYRKRYPDSESDRQVQRLDGEIQLGNNDVHGAIATFRQLAESSDDQNQTTSPTERAVTWYQLAMAYYRAEQFSEALATLDRIDTRGLAPTITARFEYARGSTYVHLQQIDEALLALDRAIEVDHHSAFAPRARWRRIVILTQDERWERAFNDLQNWESPRNKVWFYRQAGRFFAESAYAAERYQLASSAFSLLLSNLPDNADAAYGLSGVAWCSLRQENWETAADLFLRLAQSFGDDPHVPQAIRARAYSLEMTDQLGAATELYREFIRRFPDHPDRWRADLKAAELLQKQDALTDAVHVLEDGLAAVKDESTRARMQYLMAWLRRQLGEDQAAQEIFQDFYQQGQDSPYWADATYRIARQAYRRKDYATAERLVGELTSAAGSRRVNRIHPYALYLQARIAAQQSDWQAVLFTLDDLQVTQPQSSLALAAQVWSIEALYRLGDASNVQYRLAALRDAGATLKEDWQRLVDLRDAQTLAELGQWKAALDQVRAVADSQRHDDRWAEANLLVGRVGLQLAQFEDARLALNRVINESRGNIDAQMLDAAWCMMGQTYFSERQYQLAMDAYMEVRPHDRSRWYAAALYGVAETLNELERDKDVRSVLKRLTRMQVPSSYRQRAKELIQQSSTGIGDSGEIHLPVSATAPGWQRSP